MKFTLKLLSSMLMLLVLPAMLMAQAPQKFNYQGVARDAKGNPMSKQQLALKLSVLPSENSTVAEYEETQMVTTNEFGLYTLQIGNGTPVTGTMKAVTWETGNKYIKVAIDPQGGTNYQDLGTTQLLSVPYALYADNAGSTKDRSGTVSTSASGTGTTNYVTKFTAANTIYNSQIYDNGANIGIGTTSPSAKIHVNQNVAAVQEHIRMQNLSATGAGRFTLYSDGASNYSTFTKYGSSFPSGYAGIASLYPYANLLAFGNNGLASGDGLGRFLISTAGNAGISIYKSGSSKLKFHADFNTLNVGIGGNSVPVARVHMNNTDGTTMDTRLTNNTSGHTASDGLEISEEGTAARINNKENDYMSFGTNNTERMRIDAMGNVGINNTFPSTELDISSTGFGDTVGIGLTNNFDLFNISENTEGKLIFGANSSILGSSTPIMTLDDDGVNGVGIGTMNPNAKLEVSADNEPTIRITEAVPTSGDTMSLDFLKPNTAGNWTDWRIGSILLGGDFVIQASQDDLQSIATTPLRISPYGGVTFEEGITINDGSQGAGKVLTSDASGNATWKSNQTGGYVSGNGGDPTATTDFLGPTQTITITSSTQKVFWTTQKAMGSTSATGASGLSLYPAYQLSGGSITPLGGAILGLRCAQNTRQVYSISGFVTGLAPGTYSIGMAGSTSDFANWNYNEYGYTTYMIME